MNDAKKKKKKNEIKMYAATKWKEGSEWNTIEKQSIYILSTGYEALFPLHFFLAASKLENDNESYRAKKNSLHRQYQLNGKTAIEQDGNGEKEREREKCVKVIFTCQHNKEHLEKNGKTKT